MRIPVRSIWVVISPTLQAWIWERGKFTSVVEAERPIQMEEIIRMTDMIRHTCKPKPGDHFMLYTMRSADSDNITDYIPGLTPVKRIVWTEPKVDFEIREMWENE